LLVCKVNGLGDLVAFLPTLVGMRTLAEGSEITVMVPERYSALVRAVAPSVEVLGVDAVVLHAPTRNPVAFMRLARLVRRRHFDAALNSHDERSGMALLQRLAGIPVRFGFRGSCRMSGLYNVTVLPSFERSMVENDYQLVRRFAEVYGLVSPALSLPAPIFVSAGAKSSELARSTRTVTLHPLAKYEHKRWEWASFRELILKVSARRPEVRFEVLAEGIDFPMDGLPARAVQALTTEDLCRTLAASDVVVANNSGPMNVAWLLGVPLVLLSGPSPRYWSPPPSAFTREIRDRAACAPCEGPGHTPGRCLNDASPFACMRAITVDEVAAAVLQLLDRTDAGTRVSRLERLGFVDR
jgi:ADP-heptose:LPS heptosyltransferase